MCAFFKEFYMLVAFLDSQVLPPLAHSAAGRWCPSPKTYLDTSFVFKGQGLGASFCVLLRFFQMALTRLPVRNPSPTARISRWCTLHLAPVFT